VIPQARTQGHAKFFCRVPCKACGTLEPESVYYTPGRIMLVLWRYFDLVRLVGGSSAPETSSQHLPRETSEGGFESGAAIKSDIDGALRKLGRVERQIVWMYHVLQQPEVVIAAEIPGCNRWFVHRTRSSALRKMAISLGWVPKHTAATDAIDRDEDLSRAAMRVRMTMVLERAFGELPSHESEAA
jgi:hypothetical protein